MKKSFRLKIGIVLFVTALGATSFSIVWLSAQPAKETQKEEQTIYLAMAKDGGNLLLNVSGPLEGDTVRITPVVLLRAGNQTELVQVTARRNVEI